MSLIRQVAAVLCMTLAPVALASTDATTTLTADTSAVQELAADSNQPGQWQTYVEEFYLINRGYSYSPIYAFGPHGTPIDFIKAQIFVARGDICSAGIVAVAVTTDINQTVGSRVFPDANGIIDLHGAPIFKMQVTFAQNSPYTSRCGLRLSGVNSGGGEQTPTDFSMLGALSYQGGFGQIDIPVTGSKVTHFWVRLPQFCNGVEVLEAGTVTENQYDKARLVDPTKMVFEVNGGAGSRASALRVTFNGPRDKVCDVPVYIKTAP